MWWIGRKGIREEADTPGGALLIDECDYTSSDITARTFKICGTAGSREMRFKGLVHHGSAGLTYIMFENLLPSSPRCLREPEMHESPPQPNPRIISDHHSTETTPTDFPQPNRLNPHFDTSKSQSLFQGCSNPIPDPYPNFYNPPPLERMTSLPPRTPLPPPNPPSTQHPPSLLSISIPSLPPSPSQPQIRRTYSTPFTRARLRQEPMNAVPASGSQTST